MLLLLIVDSIPAAPTIIFDVRFDAAAPIIMLDNRFDPAATDSRFDHCCCYYYI